MRQIYKYIVPAVLAVLTLGACENEVDEPDAVSDFPSFTATIEGVQSRAHDDSWDVGDKIGIGIHGSETFENFSYSTVNGDGNFTTADSNNQFKFQDDSEVKFTAYYPYGTPSTNTNYPGKIATYATKSITQTPAEQKKFDYLWAEEAKGSKANPHVKFNFTHRMSKITLVFTSDEIDVSNITVYSVSGLYLRGTLDPLNGDCAVYVTSTTTTSLASVTVKNFNAKIEDGVPAPPIIVFPQTLESNPVTVSVTATTEGIGTITGSLNFKDGKLESGNEYRFVIKVSKTSLSILKSTIKGWQEEDLGEKEAS